MYLSDTESEDERWMELDQDRVQWALPCYSHWCFIFCYL